MGLPYCSFSEKYYALFKSDFYVNLSQVQLYMNFESPLPLYDRQFCDINFINWNALYILNFEPSDGFIQSELIKIL